MVVFDNLAHILRQLLVANNSNERYNEWKVLGEERDGRISVGWLVECGSVSETCVGSYFPRNNELQIILRLAGRVNIIQASYTVDLKVISYVVKESNSDGDLYSQYVTPITEAQSPDGISELKPISLELKRKFQIMTTFLDTSKNIRLLVMVHTENILVYHMKLENGAISVIRSEPVTKSFSWSQWEHNTQSLFFIHFRKTTVYEDEGERQEFQPTLSALKFHSDSPHETVLNIPLNLPSLAKEIETSPGPYEDDCIPLRVHDCSLDLLVVVGKSGVVCICHHYLYQPVKPPGAENSCPADDAIKVHFAYSVTLLHHGSVVHCALPGVPWSLAKTLRPGFTLLGTQYLLIHGPGVFTHLLDVGLLHEPFCHIMLPSTLEAIPNKSARLVTINGEFADSSASCEPDDSLAPAIMLDLLTLDLLEVEVCVQDLLQGFQNITSLSNRLSILHYFLVHAGALDLVEELLSILAVSPHDINVKNLLQEVLVGGTYSLVLRNLPADAANLVNFLPMTSIPSSGKSDVKVDNRTVSISQEILWNTALMLLSPQQRLVPYRVDFWTQLWDHLSKLNETPRFKHSQVAEKLMMSLVCYQPEALSRCSTPMSPAAGFVPACSIVDMSGLNQVGSSRKAATCELPFNEVDSCTASKQEHIISANMRELNLYLMRNNSREVPMHVHAVTTRYVTAQLDMSKQLCHLISSVVGLGSLMKTDKGFSLIRELDDNRAQLLFTLLQKFHLAADQLAFPLPQGFSSFYCYLGFTVLPFHLFLQYLHSYVFHLQVDVMKEILKETEDTKVGVEKKIRLLQLLPRSRAKRLLNTWNHPISLMIRAREHALNVLSGVQTVRPKGHAQVRKNAHATRGLAAFPSGDRVSPLDTFLDLLTAKASLTELDFTLLIEATVTSTEDFL